MTWQDFGSVDRSLESTARLNATLPGIGRDPSNSNDPNTWAGTAPEEGPGPDAKRTPPAAPFGDTASRYGPEDLIGQGGLGRVLAVHDEVLDRQVARKELRIDRPSLRERFVREARITARLDHPNIVPVYDAGHDHAGRPYYTMKRLQGRSMAEALADAGTLPERLALVDRFADVCHAVAYAHDHGVVHRDLKPENVVLGRHGETWVVDWGLAEEVGAAPTGVAGSLLWMGPDQARGAAPHPRDDVFSLGAMLFALIQGASPYADGAEAIPRLEGQVDGVPDELCAIADKALSTDEAVRYVDAGALAEDLDRWLRGLRVRAYTYTTWQLFGRWLWRHRIALGTLAAFQFVIGAMSVVFVVALKGERDAALEAERTAQVERRKAELSLARSLQEQAITAAQDGDWLRSEVLAAEALQYDDLPISRGLVLGGAAAWSPRLLSTRPMPIHCREFSFAEDAQGPLTLCLGHEGAVVLRGDDVVWSLDETVRTAAFSPDGRSIVIAGIRDVRAHALGTGATTPISDTPRSHAVVWTAEHGPVWGEGGDVVHAGARQRICSSTVNNLLQRPDGIAVVCVNGYLKIVDPETLQVVTRVRANAAPVALVANISSSQTWIGSGRGIDRIEGPQVLQRVPLAAYPSAIAASPDGSMLAVGTDNGDVVMIDPHTATLLTKMSGDGEPNDVHFDAKGHLWTSGTPGLRRWALPEPRWSRIDHISDLQVSPDGTRLALGRQDGEVHVVDKGTGLGRIVRPADGKRPFLSWSDRGLLVGSSQGLDRVDPDSGHVEPLRTGLWNLAQVDILGRHALITFNTHRVEAIDLITGRTDPELTAALGARPVLQHTPQLWVHDREKGQAVQLDPDTLEPVQAVPGDAPRDGGHASADGRWLILVGRQGRSTLIDLTGDRGQIALPRHGAVVSDVLYLTDDLVATASSDSSVRILDVSKAPVIVAELTGGGARVDHIYKAGNDLIALDWDRVVRRWDLTRIAASPAEIIREIRTKTGFAYVRDEVRFVGIDAAP